MSMIGRLVAARFLNGEVLKGWTTDFKPACTSFLVRGEDGSSRSVDTRELKAVFFIKSITGNPQHREKKGFGKRVLGGKQVWVEFQDGEELSGWSSAFASGKNGFYFTPTDPESNAERVFVFQSALRQFRVGPEAVQAAERYENKDSATAKPSVSGKIYDID